VNNPYVNINGCTVKLLATAMKINKFGLHNSTIIQNKSGKFENSGLLSEIAKYNNNNWME